MIQNNYINISNNKMYGLIFYKFSYLINENISIKIKDIKRIILIKPYMYIFDVLYSL